MTGPTITRRGAFALPLAFGLPLAAGAGGSDPVIPAFARWRAAERAWRNAPRDTIAEEQANQPLYDAAAEAFDALCACQPITPEGVALLARGMLRACGPDFEPLGDGAPRDPMNWRPEHFRPEPGDLTLEANAVRALWGVIAAAEALSRS